MKNLLTLVLLSVFLISCQGNGELILPRSVGKVNKVLIVTKSSNWLGDVGKELRNYLGEPMVGLPQPETQISVSQVQPKGFNSMMRSGRNILVIEESDKNSFTVKTNVYAKPQTVVYVTAENKDELLAQVKKYEEEILETFRSSDIRFLQNYFSEKKVDDSKYKTLQKLNLSLTIPESFKTVDDTGEFLWLRQHLLGGIARGAGSNNILVYSYPLENIETISENITAVRDSIGKKYIPGSKEGMHMITEAAYTPFTYDIEFAKNKAYETRGKWEVKNDFMAGPFLNYTILDKKNNRVLVFEGFTYAPSVKKREFIFELEAIAKSMIIK
ncbi:uncharacterized protein DUF4837 [Lutibacter sp. Hel_I_33_5]|uniref:DUF4837 family protein n=1 Tax=Lutibacter sp. Hel_I_33_5 TaxID=1566289 RepID=UPI0011A9F490|nr:DUF4837 family protein [Lutibacter sp. Hel_I_33_5]TVZ56223.1 uncharacterized protein DUF4837 [Lutibacter sp. Hel_I_33_5]